MREGFMEVVTLGAETQLDTAKRTFLEEEEHGQRAQGIEEV